jgi:hypothetical protein
LYCCFFTQLLLSIAGSLLLQYYFKNEKSKYFLLNEHVLFTNELCQ